MRNRRYFLVGVGGVIAALASISGAVGLLSPPQSAPVGLAVYRSHSVSAYQSEYGRSGSQSLSIYVDSNSALGAAVDAAVPPAGVTQSSDKRYSAYVYRCTTTGCGSPVSVSGEVAPGDVTYNINNGSVRFRKDTPCGLVDVTFTLAGYPTLSGGQTVQPGSAGIPGAISAYAGGYANASAAGTVCGYAVNTPNAYMNSWLDVYLGTSYSQFLP